MTRAADKTEGAINSITITIDLIAKVEISTLQKRPLAISFLNAY